MPLAITIPAAYSACDPSVTGLVVAAKNNQQHVIVHQTYDPTMNRYYFAVYTVWAWMAFTLNSTLSAGILIRMRYVPHDVRNQY
jgi:hypothetical protein